MSRSLEDDPGRDWTPQEVEDFLETCGSVRVSWVGLRTAAAAVGIHGETVIAFCTGKPAADMADPTIRERIEAESRRRLVEQLQHAERRANIRHDIRRREALRKHGTKAEG